MSKSYPKILIIGETFHSNSGGGITLTNLFKGWPAEKLANVVDFKNPKMNTYFASIKVYELYKSKMIFNLVSHKYFQNFRSSSLSIENKSKLSLKTFVKYIIKKYAYKLLKFSGLEPVIFNYRIDHFFLDWIKAINPDFIYTQLSSRESIKLISKLHDLTSIPIAIHIMDDWPSSIGSIGLFKIYWKRKINNEFSDLIQKSSVFLSISEAMSEEYFIRYKKKFIPFHNPLDLSVWGNPVIKSTNLNNTIAFLHAGRIGTGITDSLLEIAKTLQEINDNNPPVQLQIQSSNIDYHFIKSISKYSCVKINPPAEYRDIPKILQSADILVLCNDFDEKGKDFLKYSMPTKASEYMISKVPILLFSDYSSAVYKHAEKNKWAYLVGENDHYKLKAAILELIENIELREEISERAFHFAKANFDNEIIREKFKNEFISYV
jgi:glycosyltransferase involved in cell wall biosynthesis